MQSRDFGRKVFIYFDKVNIEILLVVLYETFPKQEDFSVQRDQQCHDYRVITHSVICFLGSLLLHLSMMMPFVFL